MHKHARTHTPIAVVGCRPHSEHSLVEMPLVSLHDELVGSTDHVYIISSIELGHDVTAKQITRSSWAYSPTCGICMCRQTDSESLRHLIQKLHRPYVIQFYYSIM